MKDWSSSFDILNVFLVDSPTLYIASFHLVVSTSLSPLSFLLNCPLRFLRKSLTLGLWKSGDLSGDVVGLALDPRIGSFPVSDPRFGCVPNWYRHLDFRLFVRGRRSSNHDLPPCWTRVDPLLPVVY
eukprot:SAG11_NODE_3330_length_2520_cov_15.369269_2_plen_127_part_00